MLSNNEMLLHFMLILIKVDEAQGDGKIAITDLTLHIFSCVVPLDLFTELEKQKEYSGDIADFAQGVFTYFNTRITTTCNISP